MRATDMEEDMILSLDEGGYLNVNFETLTLNEQQSKEFSERLGHSINAIAVQHQVCPDEPFIKKVAIDVLVRMGVIEDA